MQEKRLFSPKGARRRAMLLLTNRHQLLRSHLWVTGATIPIRNDTVVNLMPLARPAGNRPARDKLAVIGMRHHHQHTFGAVLLLFLCCCLIGHLGVVLPSLVLIQP